MCCVNQDMAIGEFITNCIVERKVSAGAYWKK